MEIILKGYKGKKILDYQKMVKRVKALIVSSDNKILLVNNYQDYQFPGGHMENNETYSEALKRELLEETGIDFTIEKDIEPVLKLYRYYEEYHETKENTLLEINYFIIRSDKYIDTDNLNLTKEEENGDFSLTYISLFEFKRLLEENIMINNDKYGISEEMFEVFDKLKNKLFFY
jgi:phosphohydrolase (mutT/nudix family protein)